MFCPNCGKDNTPQSKFCKYCGARLQTQSYEEETAKLNPDGRNRQNMPVNQPPMTDRSENNTSASANRTVNGYNNMPQNMPQQGEYYQNPQQYRNGNNNQQGYGYDGNPHDGYYKDIVTEKSKTSNAVIIVAVSLAALVLIVFAVVALIYFTGSKSDSSSAQSEASAVAPTTTTVAPVDEDNTIEIPSVVGFSYNDAVAKLHESNLQTRVTAEHSSNVPDNCIISQSPTDGTKAKEGDVVSLVMSKGVYRAPNYDYFGVPSYARNDSAYILSESSSKYLTKSDISGLSAKTLELARNEIYAKHSRRFSTTELQSYFNSKSWYVGTIEPSDFSESVLNDYETANVAFLEKQEDELRKPSSQASSSSSSKASSSSSSKASSSSSASSASSGDKPVFHEVSASTSLKSSKGTVYSPNNACYDDGNCWAEGAKDSGEGEWIMFSDDEEQQVSEIGIVNGFAKSKDLYNQNGKASRIRLEFSDGTSYSVNLTARSDATDSNYYTIDTLKLPHTISTTYVKIVIVDVVEGTKYDDTCITLVTFK